MELENKFLPIGSVVLLNEGKKCLMITSYCVFSKTDKSKVFDYGSCLYPEGVINSDNVFAFNHEDIAKVIFVGHKSDEQINLSNKLVENYDKMLEAFLSAQKAGNI